MKTLCVIPARGGSKGIPKKNIIDLNGKPLIYWSIDQARRADVDYIHVSTDDIEIARLSKKLGANCEFLRPKELADDISGTGPAVLHSIQQLSDAKFDFDLVIELQPTYCLRGSDIIRQCIRALSSDPSIDSVVTCDRIESTAHPDFAFTADSRGYAVFNNRPDVFSRHRLRPAFACHGLVLAARIASYKDQRTFFTSRCLPHVVADSMRLLDINTQQDLELVRLVVGAHPEYLS